MSWEFLRDVGLIIFATGAVVVFGLTRILHGRLGSAEVPYMATIGDAMMLAGACLAVTAMAIGYLVRGENP